MAIDELLVVQESDWKEAPPLEDVPTSDRVAENDKRIDADQLNFGFYYPTIDIGNLNTVISQRLAQQILLPKAGLKVPDVGGPLGIINVPHGDMDGQIAYRMIDGVDSVIYGEVLLMRANPYVVAVWSSSGTDNTKQADWQLGYQLLDAGDVPSTTTLDGGNITTADHATANYERDSIFPLTISGANVGKRLWLKLTCLGETSENHTLPVLDLKRIEVR